MTFSWHLWPRQKRLHPLGSELSWVSIPALPVKTSRQQTRSCLSEVRKAQHTTHPARINIPIILPFPKGLKKKKKIKKVRLDQKKKKSNAVLPFYKDLHICNSNLPLQPLILTKKTK